MGITIPTEDQALRILSSKLGVTQKQIASCFTCAGMIFAAIKYSYGLDVAVEWRRQHDLKGEQHD